MHPNILRVTPSKSALGCLWHRGMVTGEDIDKVRNEMDESASQLGYDLICGVCPECIKRYKADSLLGTTWELRV